MNKNKLVNKNILEAALTAGAQELKSQKARAVPAKDGN
jgi:hypothetical protein